jgi:hypothetical protein
LGESILSGFWHVIVFFYDFVTKAIVRAVVESLFQGAGLIVLGALVLLGIGALVVRGRRR